MTKNRTIWGYFGFREGVWASFPGVWSILALLSWPPRHEPQGLDRRSGECAAGGRAPWIPYVEGMDDLLETRIETHLSRAQMQGRPVVRHRAPLPLILAVALHIGLGVALAANLIPVARIVAPRPEVRMEANMDLRLPAEENARKAEAAPSQSVRHEPPIDPEVPLPRYPEVRDPSDDPRAQLPEDPHAAPAWKPLARPLIFARCVIQGIRPRPIEATEEIPTVASLKTEPSTPHQVGFAQPDPKSGQSPKPRYPRRALEREWEGAVRVCVSIDDEGRPTSVKVLSSSGHALLDRIVTGTILDEWRFTPGRRDGQAVPSTWTQEFVFRLIG